jgi:hypothetical protein
LDLSIGIAAGMLVDATIVRASPVPSLMALLGLEQVGASLPPPSRRPWSEIADCLDAFAEVPSPGAYRQIAPD